MKSSQRFKDGARDAWRFIRRGLDTGTLLKLAETESDPYVLGWKAQCEDPETELHPPDYREPADGDAYVGVMTGLAITCFAVSVAVLLLGFLKAGMTGFAISFFIVYRISKTR